jgi:hypothetical protein
MFVATAQFEAVPVPASDTGEVQVMLDYFNATYYAIRQYSPTSYIMITPRIFEVSPATCSISAASSMH